MFLSDGYKTSHKLKLIGFLDENNDSHSKPVTLNVKTIDFNSCAHHFPPESSGHKKYECADIENDGEEICLVIQFINLIILKNNCRKRYSLNLNQSNFH